MKIKNYKHSAYKLGQEMAELHRLAITFDEKADDNDRYPMDMAYNEAMTRIDHLKERLIFKRPGCIGDILVLALVAANHLEKLQPGALPKNLERTPSTDQYIAAGKTIPILRLLDAIITGIEENAEITREDIGLSFLRKRENDKEQLFEKALDTIMESEAKDQKTKKAA
jgi:hypothetical protein